MISRNSHPCATRYSTPVTGASLRALEALELDVALDHVKLTHAHFRFGEQHQEVFFDIPWLMVRRDLFDAWLFQQVAREVEVREGERVQALREEAGWIIIETDQRTWRARWLVVAAGSNSMVREAVYRHHDHPPVSTALQHSHLSFAPLQPEYIPHDTQGCLTYDFSVMAEHAPGYIWSASGLNHDDVQTYQTHVGLLQQTPRGTRHDNAQCLQELAAQRIWPIGAETPPITHHVHHFSPDTPLSTHNILITGEAAGLAPLLDDGLGQCLEYGILTGHMVRDAFDENTRLDLTTYDDHLRRCALGRDLLACQQLTERFFGEDWRFWISRLINHPDLPTMLTRHAGGVEAVHQKKFHLTLTTLMHKLIGDKSLPDPTRSS